MIPIEKPLDALIGCGQKITEMNTLDLILHAIIVRHHFRELETPPQRSIEQRD
jgi:hypothetical protein